MRYRGTGLDAVLRRGRETAREKSRLVIQRAANTLSAFSLIGRAAEGERRARAQAVAGGLTDSPLYIQAFSRVLHEDADAVVVRTAVLWLIEPLLAKSGDEWRRVGGDEVFTVYIKGSGA